uniref:Aerolysin-like protein n=1 Tax=Bombina maxima TaxID=161274 RepID=A0A6N0C223_BOMMX|nr:aerolysin-like protein [Bombina maxima]6LH8_A Chain A, aerolysin-like protein [Bombina maxima]6LHZ_A Chain A, aerolysin-like protein [Bombina maxima]
MSASVTVLWDKEIEGSNEVVKVDEMVASNISNVKVEFYLKERHFDRTITHNITLPRATEVPIGTEIQLEPKHRLNGNTEPITFTYGSLESYTELSEDKVTMPEFVEPKTKLIVILTRNENITSAPVEISVGDIKETATYICQSQSGINAEVNTEPL